MFKVNIGKTFNGILKTSLCFIKKYKEIMKKIR